jgi:cell division protein ZapB
MNDRLDGLEKKVEQMLAFCQMLRAENQTLRDRVAGLEGENRTLVDKIETARGRLETLMDRLPEQ